MLAIAEPAYRLRSALKINEKGQVGALNVATGEVVYLDLLSLQGRPISLAKPKPKKKTRKTTSR